MTNGKGFAIAADSRTIQATWEFHGYEARIIATRLRSCAASTVTSVRLAVATVADAKAVASSGWESDSLPECMREPTSFLVAARFFRYPQLDSIELGIATKSSIRLSEFSLNQLNVGTPGE